ncbi:MAG: alpha-galactosidase [Oscillospiraceae bacterium]|nr:alpha-galactosidase [Oscillospiraceae bacterium]
MLQFKNLRYTLTDNQIKLDQLDGFTGLDSGFVQVQIAGENKDSHLGAKMYRSSEAGRLIYKSHTVSGNTLTVVQESPNVRTETTFEAYDDTNALRIQTKVTNITAESIVLEEVSAFCVSGLGEKQEPDDMFFTNFLQSHHAECQPRTKDFRELGLCGGLSESQQRVVGCNVGSWSTKEQLPMGILENRKTGNFLMFQVESNSSWYYEISDTVDRYYLYVSGPTYPFGGWFKTLQPGESYVTPYVSLSFGKDLNDVIGNMTKYRRHIAGVSPADEKLPTIFNEYMHLSWDSPTAENTAKYAPVVAKTGVEYYVIDCGWHNEEDGDKVYPFVGHWLESKARFPEGVKKTTDFIRSLGMKPGLWIEPEIIGMQCQKMLEHYDDDCFFQRHGKRLTVMNRQFLDYRNPKVREYMTETIRRMVEDYGAEYIKCDYNQDCGIGTDWNAESPGAGLEEAANAFLEWIREMIAKYPNVVFEGCSSGGMRMDYKTLSAYSLVSTSDQTNYLLYPYIAGNILAAVLPEQAAVWSYPVASDCEKGEDVSDDRIVINMINSFLGRMHLASHLDYLNEHQMDLIREGVEYYNTLSEMKKTALPYFPMGFTQFGEKTVCAGLKNDNKIYLAVWNLKGEQELFVPIAEGVNTAKIAYPTVTSVQLENTKDGLKLTCPQNPCAVFLEITTM